MRIRPNPVNEPAAPTTIHLRGRRIEIGLDASDAQELVHIITSHDPTGKLGWRSLAESLQRWVDEVEP